MLCCVGNFFHLQGPCLLTYFAVLKITLSYFYNLKEPFWQTIPRKGKLNIPENTKNTKKHMQNRKRGQCITLNEA